MGFEKMNREFLWQSLKALIPLLFLIFILSSCGGFDGGTEVGNPGGGVSTAFSPAPLQSPTFPSGGEPSPVPGQSGENPPPTSITLDGQNEGGELTVYTRNQSETRNAFLLRNNASSTIRLLRLQLLKNTTNSLPLMAHNCPQTLQSTQACRIQLDLPANSTGNWQLQISYEKGGSHFQTQFTVRSEASENTTLQSQLESSVEELHPGEEFTVSLRSENSGSNPLHDLWIRLALPQGLRLIWASYGCYLSADQETLTCPGSDLQASSPAFLEVHFQAVEVGAYPLRFEITAANLENPLGENTEILLNVLNAE